jgi:hypothetical protein
MQSVAHKVALVEVVVAGLHHLQAILVITIQQKDLQVVRTWLQVAPPAVAVVEVELEVQVAQPQVDPQQLVVQAVMVELVYHHRFLEL